MNAGRLMIGQKGFVPCTPLGVMKLLEAYGIPICGKHAVIIGRSNIVGKPMAMLLLAANATVTLCHSHTQGLAELTRQADIPVSYTHLDVYKRQGCMYPPRDACVRRALRQPRC